MKKSTKKLALSRETVGNLETSALRAAGGSGVTVTQFDCTANGACVSGHATCFSYATNCTTAG
ncbi:MAG TPA: hypothetical protein VGH73_24235 [Thermoanaerobaculia bacterium]